MKIFELPNNEVIVKSENKTKATWTLIKIITRPNYENIERTIFQSFAARYQDSQIIVNQFNSHFSEAYPNIGKSDDIDYGRKVVCEATFI